jgi:hypothetical protein
LSRPWMSRNTDNRGYAGFWESHCLYGRQSLG